ncbi:hypothetical protein [Nitrosospira sp. NpAV]|uniref:hypothetical protein n=1 Tax=Nitrosospira sp. NpAV TaxID=58133 RepID=UPI0005A284A0|nr:hypothetical protein [Nitrosospira sp. NpAV]KIO49619.1 hypothetical protein SQ11_05740 [Nitrosospira sp. NpAV]
MTTVVVNGVDLELLRDRVHEGYNASSATVIALIQIALAEPALREELKVERSALQAMSRDIAEIAFTRISDGPDAAISALDDFIKRRIRLMPIDTKRGVH